MNPTTHLLKYPILLLALLLTAFSVQGQSPYASPVVASNADTVAPTDSATTFDYRVLKSLQDSRTPGWDRHWVMVSNTFVLAPLFPAGFALGGAATQNDPLVRNQLYADAMESVGAYMLCMGVTMGMKALVGRPRPWVAYEGDLVCLQPVRSTSFPSGHTSSAFVAATSLSLMYPRWYVIAPAYLWAGAVAFSRMYVGAHFPTDVLAGAAIGTGCAFLAHAVRVRLCKDHPELYPPDAVLIPLSFQF